MADADDGLENSEWRLSEFVDALAAEVDHAEDSLSLKSYGRSIAFALQELHIDLGVSVRRAADGSVWFRTAPPGEPPTTTLHLDLAQVLEGQMEGTRQDLTRPGDRRPLEVLPGITPDEVQRFAAVGIFSMDDLERLTASAPMIAEIGRKTGISDGRIRMWRALPFIAAVTPIAGPPGTVVTVDGGGFGDARGDADFFFQDREATVVNWSASRVVLSMPLGRGHGSLFGVIGGQLTNVVAWDALVSDVFVSGIATGSVRPVEGDTLSFSAGISNRGSADSLSFDVQWERDGKSLPLQPHGPLRSGKASVDAAATARMTLTPGTHDIGVVLDPNGRVAEIDRATARFSTRVNVDPAQVCRIADYRTPLSLDPYSDVGEARAEYVGLVFRGLLRMSVDGLVPDLATITSASDKTRLVFEVREGASFHDGEPVRAQDVEYSYQTAMDAQWTTSNILAELISEIEVSDDRHVVIQLSEPVNRVEPLTVPIVPTGSYEPNPVRPIGAGPFFVEKDLDGGTEFEVVYLRAFDDYVGGRPRLTHVRLSTMDTGRLTEQLLAGALDIGILPYSDAALQQLRGKLQLKPTPLPAARPRVIDAQSARLRERDPTAADVTWNAHVWYLTGQPGGTGAG
jgi:peptide/nickel transport system substrate-binding protein